MTALSTHVLDLTSGTPAGGVAVQLFHVSPGSDQRLLSEVATDADGRARLLAPGDLVPGAYRLTFGIGAYFGWTGALVTDPPFLNVVVIDFSVADATRHHHVPLLVSPYGYSTYRGS